MLFRAEVVHVLERATSFLALANLEFRIYSVYNYIHTDENPLHFSTLLLSCIFPPFIPSLPHPNLLYD